MVFHFNGRLIFSLTGQWDMYAPIALEAGKDLAYIGSLFGENDTQLLVSHRMGLVRSFHLHSGTGSDGRYVLERQTALSDYRLDGYGMECARRGGRDESRL